MGLAHYDATPVAMDNEAEFGHSLEGRPRALGISNSRPGPFADVHTDRTKPRYRSRRSSQSRRACNTSLKNEPRGSREGDADAVLRRGLAVIEGRSAAIVRLTSADAQRARLGR